MNSGIYKILNTVNGKQYVGSAKNLGGRKRTHWFYLKRGTHHNIYLQRAWSKHGGDAFEFQIIGRCPPEKLVRLEQEVMDHLKPEYNIATMAGSTLGVKLSEETKRKLSKSHTGFKYSEEHRRKNSESHMGIKPSIETRLKMSAAQRNKSEEHKRKISESMKAWWSRKKSGLE